MNHLVLDLPTGQFPSHFNSVLLYPVSMQGKITVIFFSSKYLNKFWILTSLKILSSYSLFTVLCLTQ